MQINFPGRVSEKYKGLSYAFFQLDDLAEYGSEDERRAVEARIAQSIRSAYPDSGSWEENPTAQAYVRFYSSMGLNGRKCSNPIQQAYRFKNADYRSKTRIIDSAMEIEYTRGISFQLYDFDRLGASLTIDIAEQPRAHVDHRGKEATCRTGELILFSERGLIHCPSMGNGRDFGLNVDSRRALVRLMLVPGVDPKKFEAAIQDVWSSLRPAAATYLAAPPFIGELSTAIA
jgi:DNA/RNA-binding domain of Phe-tRNA-synthetase-like protein